MSAEISSVEPPSAVEHGSSEASQFSANLFAGPCFGDLTPSEVVLRPNTSVAANIDIQSSLATLPDAPSPSPLLLTSIPDQSHAKSAPILERETGYLIDFTSAEETASDLVLPSNDPTQYQIPDPSNATLLIDSNLEYHQEPSQSLDTSSLLPMNVFDGRSDAISMLHFDDSSDNSSVLLCLDEQPLVPEPSTELPNPNFPTANEGTSPNLTNLPMLDESPPIETTEPLTLPIDSMSDEPSNPTHPSILDENTFPDLTNTEPHMLNESFPIETLPTDFMSNDPANPPNAHFPQLPSTQLSVLDESSPLESTEPLTVPMSDESADSLVFPSSSPTDEPASSPFPLTPPTCPGSQPPLDAIDSSTSFPLTVAHSNPRSSEPLPTPHEIEPIDFGTFLPPSSSPPNSSPRPIFSSSPPPASDSSVPPADDFGAQKELESNTDIFSDSTDLDASSPQQSSPLLIPRQMERDPASLELIFSEPPPSSSPLPPSSSPSDVLQFVETTEQGSRAAESSDEILRALKLEHEEVLPQTAISDSSDMEVNFSNADYDGLSASIILGKRKREEEEAKAALQGEEISEEMSTQPPNPKRPTLASQKLQRKMLAKPFRSPAMTPKAAEATPAVKKEAPPPEQLLGKAKDADLKKHRTQRAAGQFKSPLPLALAGSVPTAVRQTPTVQTLERKVQVLKRAVQVRKDGEEETLEGLVRKWTEAGREVAWEVWGLVKDNENGGGDDWGEKSQGASSSSGKRRFEDSWGWNEESGSKRVKVEEGERNWGWDVSPATASSEQDQDHPKVVETVEDEEKPRDTLGTMLMRLGIAPSTLGWDDEEGEFVDE